jgi:hypothetical protein
MAASIYFEHKKNLFACQIGLTIRLDHIILLCYSLITINQGDLVIFVLYRTHDKDLRCVAGIDRDEIDAFVASGDFHFSSPINISEQTVRDLGFTLLKEALESISKGNSSTFLLGLPTIVPGNRHRAELKQQS